MSKKDAIERNEASPLRRFVLELSAKNMDLISKGSRVLEIGCGKKEDVKRLVNGINCQWFGIDVRQDSVATHRGSVSNIPFEDGFFDVAIASQTIEHWYEYMTTFEEGLSEIYRVLRHNGLLLVDYPVHLHGHPIFMLGKKSKIYNLFDRRFWDIAFIKSYHPDVPYYTWSGKRIKVVDQFVMELILKLKNKPSYIEQIAARKINLNGEGTLSPKKINNFIYKQFLFLLSIIRKLHEKLVYSLIR